ncbi:phosphoprotein associated with glycosphingolipid-enriched microdomains 1-like [Xyrauchen texanus]|uniref:phosphoprotein associated with glycosphingolipid-enriched microdomains 1-like n=1 Tax=Xyrauchen texanus TaxID=154827 RepID=UPI0022428F40|nr:phosphoprotein associated with glycosphingolipid-enriched microdomains 1-like [Xyrauchen texanus]XP_051949569.1 phosphoprotein associated with glycosphingolipid-enriched microdomains 1-like [Xyrauchen texanus]XP_051949570.1 phosphoprotein associated with glycosphingolipid-enriched microdomains 1-like [Xyrauchen texanus]XP_051949571.1 phosphoprotein associated with glycosphingolipid-enriched microdomains 1-like [Xyrauchen texanus]
MAPALSAMLGSEVVGTAVLATGELALVGTLTGLSAFLLLSILLLLCAGCQGQKKVSGHPGDHENLMNGVSEKETCSQSAESHGTDLAISSSHNGPLTSGTVLTDTMDTSPQPSEDMLSSQSEIRSSKCHQDRELPSIPPTDVLKATVVDGQAALGDGTYEVVKNSASRDVSVEDSLYETVKELKDSGLPNGTMSPEEPPAPLLNGHPSPATSDRTVLPNGVEYASINLSKKSRYSTDMEARRSAAIVDAIVEPEDEKPPPIPDKVLDENDNQQINDLPNGQLHSPLSTPELQDHALPDSELSDMYSIVHKPVVKETEHDYSSIGEIKRMVTESTSSDIYATVRDEYPLAPGSQNAEPGYETIKIPQTAEGAHHGSGILEPDYESMAELGLNREMTRL